MIEIAGGILLAVFALWLIAILVVTIRFWLPVLGIAGLGLWLWVDPVTGTMAVASIVFLLAVFAFWIWQDSNP